MPLPQSGSQVVWSGAMFVTGTVHVHVCRVDCVSVHIYNIRSMAGPVLISKLLGTVGRDPSHGQKSVSFYINQKSTMKIS